MMELLKNGNTGAWVGRRAGDELFHSLLPAARCSASPAARLCPLAVPSHLLPRDSSSDHWRLCDLGRTSQLKEQGLGSRWMLHPGKKTPAQQLEGGFWQGTGQESPCPFPALGQASELEAWLPSSGVSGPRVKPMKGTHACDTAPRQMFKHNYP